MRVLSLSFTNSLILPRSFSTQKLSLPELTQADTQFKSHKYQLANQSYHRVIQIMESAHLDVNYRREYLQTVAKFVGSSCLLKKYQRVIEKVETVKIQKYGEQEEGVKDYLGFVEAVARKNEGIQHKKQVSQLSSIVDRLLDSQANTKNTDNRKYPILSEISKNINNSADYRKLFLSLIQRSPKSTKQQHPSPNFITLTSTSLNPQLLILSLTSILLSTSALTTADKALLNNTANAILQKYQAQNQKQVYKPLLFIIMSLIAQKHYMSAQGMIGYVKGQQSMYGKGEDRNLVFNLYRMLVTRANNQPFQLGWEKQEKVRLGNLVVQRVLNAPLMGHGFANLIC